ncbi:hypothetical protein AVEN_59904-1 [Araneus ventricosus]|uniref:Uncharacterized protein n=1 Tax=Araneus ventricosus TaxID=182803 RepID=A0A4Y2EGS2_ARAVE|nr:hypothetical protein AVEN_59904-1 [Araneus ventricosus]
MKRYTLTKFLVHTTNVQCVHFWSPSTHPNGNPVPFRRSIACFRQCPSQQQWCVPAVLAALLALGVHKLCLSHNLTGRNHMAWDLESHGNRGTSSRPVMWQFSVEKFADNCAPVILLLM